jgi:hypothetical protein
MAEDSKGERILCMGYTVDFGEMWATIRSQFHDGGRIGVELNRSGSGLVNAKECRRIATFLEEAADWLDDLEKPSSGPIGPVVYAITDGDGRCKIGKAVDIKKRMKQLQTGNPKQLRLAAYLRCGCASLAIRAESASHRALDGCRLYGEWFKCDVHTALQALYEGGSAVGIERHPVMLVSDEWMEAVYGE